MSDPNKAATTATTRRRRDSRQRVLLKVEAIALEGEEQHDDARVKYDEVLAKQQRVGHDHPDTMKSVDSFIMLCSQ
jgi:hypothetical protein